MSVSLQSTETDRQSIEEFAYSHGLCFDSYLILEPDRKHFWSKSREGVVGYVQLRKYIKIAGGLIAPDEHKAELLSELVQFAQERKLFLSFYNITEGDLPLFSKFGFQVTKWGEEPIVDLADRSWEGKSFEWVRRQSNYCRRKGLVFSECQRDAMPAHQWDGIMSELREISDELVRTRPQATDIKFMQGEVDAENLGRKRIFVARADGGSGRIEGFLVCNPGMNGDFWAFEIYRHRPDAVRGTVPFLMHQTMQQLQQEGVRHVSLCLVPGMGCNESLPGDSALARLGLVLGAKYLGFIFDTAGMYHFKSRFRPRFESRYICVRPKVTIGSTWAFLQILGVFNLNFGKLCRSIWDHARKYMTRTTLSDLHEDAGQPVDSKHAMANAKPHIHAKKERKSQNLQEK